MNLAATLVAAFVAFQHAAFLALEMFLWTKPAGRKIFGTTEEFANASAALAMNQGLYNGFLVAGIVWALVGDPAARHARLCFFLGCVVVAGLFGGATVKRTIAFIQAGPALLGLVLLCLASR
jgi:putative membrane protein